MIRIVLSVLLLAINSISFANSIQGTISLPSGQTAPTGGATFEVTTFPLEFNFDIDDFFVSSTDVTIPAGQSTASYLIRMPDTSSNPSHRVSFDCLSGCNSMSVTTTGFVSTASGVVGSLFSATRFPFILNRHLNIGLELADMYSGVILFPGDMVASGNEQLVLSVKPNEPFSLEGFTQYIYPAKGQRSWPFLIGVPEDITLSSLGVELSCNTCASSISGESHYPTRSTGDPVTLVENSQYFFPDGKNFANINLTLLSASTTNSIAPILLLLLD